MQDEERANPAGLDGGAQVAQTPALVGKTHHRHACAVGVEIGAAQEAVRFAEARDDIRQHSTATEGPANFRQQVSLFVGHPTRSHDADLVRREFAQARGEARDEVAPRGGDSFAALAGDRFL